MSDFHPKSFKMAFIASLILENKIGSGRSTTIKEDLEELRHYAEQKYQIDATIEGKFLDYYLHDNRPQEMRMFNILCQMFGDP